MSGAHVSVALSDSRGDGQVTVFTVHVVGGGPRVVTQPDTDVLHKVWVLLIHLSNMRQNINKLKIL